MFPLEFIAALVAAIAVAGTAIRNQIRHRRNRPQGVAGHRRKPAAQPADGCAQRQSLRRPLHPKPPPLRKGGTEFLGETR